MPASPPEMVSSTSTPRFEATQSTRGLRIATDLPIPQLPWWEDVVDVLPWPNRVGVVGTLQAAWATVRRARHADVFVGSTLRNAMALAVFKRLGRRQRPRVVLTEMRLDDPRAGWRWLLKVALQRFAFRAVDIMCVSARGEIQTYAERLRLPVDRFRHLPWHTNVLEPLYCEPNGSYVFAAGRTGRDWRTLAEAVRGLDIRVTVVCAGHDAGVIAFPANVTVLTDVPYTVYRELLEGAAVVAIPLEPHVYSSGQVVILEAMGLGKAVVTTRVVGSEDYILDGIDGVLVDPGDAAGLRAAISDLAASHPRQRAIGEAALSRVRRDHTLEQYATRVLHIARALALPQPGEAPAAAEPKLP